MIQAMWEVLLSLAPWMLLGMAIAGILHVALPRGFVRRHLGGRGGVAKAVALGVPLPLCSCGVIPAGLGLKRDGASDGAAVGFLISTPQTGVDSILVSASFLGWPFALFKVLAATITGLFLIVGGGDIGALAPGFRFDGVHAESFRRSLFGLRGGLLAITAKLGQFRSSCGQWTGSECHFGATGFTQGPHFYQQEPVRKVEHGGNSV